MRTILPILLAYTLGFIWGKLPDATVWVGFARFAAIAAVMAALLGIPFLQ